MKEIPLTQGKTANIDDDDFERVSKHKWYALKPKKRNNWYARTNIQLGPCKRKGVPMHRFILNAKPGDIIDHINGNGLDNRKSNLRIVTNQQNCANKRPHKNTSSKYKGVSWHIRRRQWQTNICKDGKNYYLGLFESEEAAAEAYNLKAVELFGEFARLNKISIGSESHAEQSASKEYR